MARTLEELIILKRTALRYILARESKLLALGKRPVNKKIANFIRNHEESTTWSNFYDSLSEDLTRNINIYELRFGEERRENRRRYRLFSETKEVLIHRSMYLRGGRMTEAPVVTVEQGQLQGCVANTPSGKAYYSFQGIPYAKPPLGSLRFKAPQPIEAWEGIRDATSEGNVSAQIEPYFVKQYIGDENCLFLNIYTPNIDGAFLPVMVYTHGGAFKFGSGHTDMYGADFLVEKDVVVVTINYRLGALGFLSLNTPEVPGNAGIKDVILALKWVKENIHNFGGNSGNLTVFGESAGGAISSLLTASPLSKGLISRAIVQSGNALSDYTFQKQPIENAIALAEVLGCEADNIDDILEFLTTTPAKDIVEAQEKVVVDDNVPNSFVLVVEKEFANVEAVITEPFIDLLTSGRVAHVPIMIGSTTLEFAFERKSDDLQYFIPKELNIERNSQESLAIAERIKKLYFKGSATGVESLNEYYQLLSDRFINVDTHRYVQYLVNTSNSPIYYYKFDYVGELNISSKTIYSLGLKHAMHLDDLGYLFKNEFQREQEPTPQDIKMRERMVRLWTNFAKTGNPTPEENHYLTVTWLPVTKDTHYYLNLGSELSLETNPDKEKMEFWDELYSKYFKIWDHPRSNGDTRVTTTEIETSGSTQIITTTVVENLVEITNNETGVSVVKETIIITDASPEITDASPEETDAAPEITHEQEKTDEPIAEVKAPEIVETVKTAPVIVDTTPITEEKTPEVTRSTEVTHAAPEITHAAPEKTHADLEITTDVQKLVDNFRNLNTEEVHLNGNGVEKSKPRTSNEIKMAASNGAPKDVIRANDPPEDDLPKNIGVNKFVNFFESLGGKK